EHPVEELDVEVLFQGEHEVHGGERGESRFVKVGLVVEGAHVYEQPPVRCDDVTDLRGIHVVFLLGSSGELCAALRNTTTWRQCSVRRRPISGTPVAPRP